MRILFIFLILVSTVYANVHRISLVIGNDQGLYGETLLKYATRDAQRFNQLLLELGDIDPRRNYLLLNKKKQEIIRILHEIKGRVIELKNNNQEILFYIYYSGHADQDALHIAGEKIQIKTVRDFFQALQADVKIMLVDACYSGNILREKGIKLGKPIDINFNDQLKIKGSAILTSSSAGELSHESEELQGSLFTHYLITGLRGGADFNKDNSVSLLEAYHYAQTQTLNKVNHTKNVTQNPAFDLDLVGHRDINLTFIENAYASIHFVLCDGEEYSIISPRTQEVIANISPGKADTITIALPQDNYIIQKKTEKYLYIANADLTWDRSFTFYPGLMEIYPLESVISKGRFNWQFQSFQVLIHQGIRKDLLMNKKWIYIPRVTFKYNFQKYIFYAGISYWQDQLIGDFLYVNRKSVEFTGGCTYRFYFDSRLILDGGIEVGLININQLPKRKNEAILQQIGYDPLPEKTAMVYQYGLKQNFTYLFKYGFLINVQIGISSYYYEESDKTKNVLRFPVSFGIGLKF